MLASITFSWLFVLGILAAQIQAACPNGQYQYGGTGRCYATCPAGTTANPSEMVCDVTTCTSGVNGCPTCFPVCDVYEGLHRRMLIRW